MEPTVFFLINSIDLQRGGLTRASLKQASFFAEMGYSTYMLTFNFNPRYPIIRKNLLELNKIHKDVIIRNMYEELAGYEEPLISSSTVKKASLTELSKGNTVEQRKGHNAYRVYENGIYTKYISLADDNSLHYIDYFNNNRYRTKRETYDPWGNLKKIAYMDYTLNRPRQLIYYNNDQKAYLTQWNNPNNNSVERIIIFNNDSSVRNTFVKDNITHKVNWLNDTIDRFGSEQSVVISDTRSTDEVLINFNHPKAAKIWRLHSSHLDKPFTADAPITKAVQPGLSNLEGFDAAVFLTEEQKKDIIYRFGNKSNLKVIPHFHEAKGNLFHISLRSNDKTDNKLCVVVSRLSSLKRIDHTIKAFRKVVDEIHDARLEIWGTGKEDAKLKTLINNLDLAENVYLKGYTHTPDAIYQKGLFSVMTSKKEGFALSVLESMYNKTPVISYKLKYGPTDMIIDGENGYIVENADIEQLADRMISMFHHPELSRKMGKQARRYIDKHFNKNIYKKKWLETINTALSNKFGP